MTRIERDKLLSEITASLTHLMESGALADLDSHDQVRLVKQLSAAQAELESLTKRDLKDATDTPRPQPSEYPDEELRRKWKNPPLTPEFREWALQLFTEEEIVAGLREIEDTGGLELADFIHELDEIVERP